MRDLLFHDASHRLPSAKRLACFDELTRGDGRLPGRPLHYGCKPGCCSSVAETQRLFAAHVPAVLLKTPPVLFPRKSWHGQAEAMNPIIQLEATNGLLSQCFRSVEAAAKVRSEKALDRLASKMEQDKRGPRANDSQGAPQTDKVDAESHCQTEKDFATQAAENAQRARDVLDFLSERDALRCMVRLRTLIEPYRKLKSSILGRSGKNWEQSHMASLIQAVPAEHQASSKAASANSRCSGEAKVENQNTREQSPLRYPVCCAALSHEVEEALRSLTGLVAQPWGALQGLHGAPDGALRWCEVSIAGAALYQFVVHEQRQYPWKLFRVLEDDDAAFEIIDDQEQCQHILDPLARQHLTAYPDVAALQGAASKAELTSMAIVLEDNTSRIERGHSTVKRAAEVAEQTHTSQITVVSAERLISRARSLGESWHGKALRAATDTAKSDHRQPARGAKRPTEGPHQRTRGAAERPTEGPHQRTRGAAERRKRKNRTQRGQGRKRAVTARNAWMAVHAAGHFITSADHRRFAEAMQNTAEAKKYQQMAIKMTRGKKHRRRGKTSHVAELRRQRENARRKGAGNWDPTGARRQIEQHRSGPYGKAETKRIGIVQREHRRTAAAAREVERVLSLFAKSHSPEIWKSMRIASNLVPHPVRQGGLHAARWAAPLQRRAPELMPAAMQSQLQHLSHWDQQHETLQPHPVVHKIPRESKKTRHNKQCRLATFCVCSPSKRHCMTMVDNICAALKTILGALGSTMRGDLDSGRLVLRMASCEPDRGCHWYHLPLMALDLMRPTFLKCLPASRSTLKSHVVDGQHGATTIIPATLTHAQRLCWQTVWEAAYDLEEDSKWSMELWHIIGGGTEPSQGVHAHQHPSVLEAYHVWGGIAELEKADGAPGSDDSEGEDEMPEADLVAPMPSVLPARTTEGARQQKPAPPMPVVLKPPSSSPTRGPDQPQTADARASSPSIMRAQLDATKIKRQGDRGQQVVITTSEGTEIPALVTFRARTAKKRFGGYQITCRYHEPEQRVNKWGKPYTLACRRSRDNKCASDDDIGLTELYAWIMAAAEYSSRQEHQDHGKVAHKKKQRRRAWVFLAEAVPAVPAVLADPAARAVPAPAAQWQSSGQPCLRLLAGPSVGFAVRTTCWKIARCGGLPSQKTSRSTTSIPQDSG